MGILEWIGAHLLGPVVSFYRAFLSQPRPKLKIHELVPIGGGGLYVQFRFRVQNIGNQPTRATITARVDDVGVTVQRPIVELLPNTESSVVEIQMPRPQLGELVKAFNSEPTLYGRTLVVEIADEKRRATISWSEHVYTPEENPQRHEFQQRVWRLGRGEATEDDLRNEYLNDLRRRRDERGLN